MDDKISEASPGPAAQGHAEENPVSNSTSAMLVDGFTLLLGQGAAPGRRSREGLVVVQGDGMIKKVSVGSAGSHDDAVLYAEFTALHKKLWRLKGDSAGSTFLLLHAVPAQRLFVRAGLEYPAGGADAMHEVRDMATAYARVLSVRLGVTRLERARKSRSRAAKAGARPASPKAPKG